MTSVMPSTAVPGSHNWTKALDAFNSLLTTNGLPEINKEIIGNSLLTTSFITEKKFLLGLLKIIESLSPSPSA